MRHISVKNENRTSWLTTKLTRLSTKTGILTNRKLFRRFSSVFTAAFNEGNNRKLYKVRQKKKTLTPTSIKKVIIRCEEKLLHTKEVTM